MTTPLVMRPFKPEDAEKVISWVSQSPKDLFYFSSQFEFPLQKNTFLNYCEKNFDAQSHVAFSFLDPQSQEHIGHCELKAISPKHLNSTIAHVLVCPTARGKGYGRRMLTQMLDYAFEKRGLNRVGLAVGTENTQAIQAYLKVGFQIEGLIRDVLRFEGEYFSLYQMGILKVSTQNS